MLRFYTNRDIMLMAHFTTEMEMFNMKKYISKVIIGALLLSVFASIMSGCQFEFSVKPKQTSTIEESIVQSQPESTDQSEASEISKISEISEISETSQVSAASEVSQTSTISKISSNTDETSSTVKVGDMTLKEFCELSQTKTALDAMKERMTNETCTMDYSVEGEKSVVFTVHLKNALKNDEVVKSSLKVQTEAGISNFVQLIEGFEKGTGIDGVQLIIRYRNPDGAVLYEETFDKNSTITTATTQEYNSLYEYVFSEDMQQQIAYVNQQYPDQTLRCYVKDEHTLVYEYTYNTNVDNQETAKKLEANFKTKEGSIPAVVSDLKIQTGDNEASIKYLYKDRLGTVIFEKIFR